MRKLSLVICIVLSCKPRRTTPTFENIELKCGVTDHAVATCVGKGRVFKCVDQSRGCENGPWACAPYEGPLP